MEFLSKNYIKVKKKQWIMVKIAAHLILRKSRTLLILKVIGKSIRKFRVVFTYSVRGCHFFNTERNYLIVMVLYWNNFFHLLTYRWENIEWFMLVFILSKSILLWQTANLIIQTSSFNMKRIFSIFWILNDTWPYFNVYCTSDLSIYIFSCYIYCSRILSNGGMGTWQT